MVRQVLTSIPSWGGGMGGKLELSDDSRRRQGSWPGPSGVESPPGSWLWVPHLAGTQHGL